MCRPFGLELIGHLEWCPWNRKLGDFIDAPGTLTLRTPKGRPVSILEFLTLSGRFGSLFQVEVRPGSATLTKQSEDLFPR